MAPAARAGARRRSAATEHGTGILNNPLDVDKRVRNKRKCMKDPERRKRRSRVDTDADVIATDVPERRIVSEEWWAPAGATT